MKILFIYPDIITNTMNFCPAIHMLSAVMKREGYLTSMLHINNDNGVKYDRKIIIELSEGYDLFAVTSTTFNYKYANEIAGWLKESYPNILRILGGSHATIQPEDFESSNFDIFCVGEGEEPMKDLVRALECNMSWNKIPNLITRNGTNPVRGFMRDLDSLPYWDFDITDTQKIIDQRKGFLSISFSRGCPYECTFCINHLYKKIEMGKGDRMSDYLRRRTPENTVNELEFLAKRFKIKYFNIDDDLLTINKRWMREFTDRYANQIYKPFNIKYIINARADSLTEDVVKMLADSGCKEARLGFETGNEKVRNKLLDKRTSNEDLIKACANLDKYGVQSVAFAMIGLPGESWDTFGDTLDMTIKLRPKLMRMTFLYPYKHTKIYDYCFARDLFKNEELTDNRDYGSCLKFDKINDQELFCMRFLFPWFVNEQWFFDIEYTKAIAEFISLPLSKLKHVIPDIIEKDKELSENCTHSHYRYFSGNEYYFELHDNLKDTIQN